LFLMPSEKESFGLAALEAMSCEVPVVSSNTGGIPELNINGVTGFVSPVGAIDEMVKNSLYILSDEHLPQFKANALKRAKDFDIEKIVPLYEKFYQRIIDEQMAVL
ncbi:MAG: glycosyltransferase, partial [Pontibacter sp.]|nr:glycosyltransferase [Pontibacter sp.]